MSESGISNQNAGDAASAASDWRSSVLQSYRNAEVREIAKVLAEIEGQTTTPASKLMLAMRFEDQIFKSAASLADYRKRISKRLKKLQKNYVPPKEQTASGTGDGTSSEDVRKRQALLLELRQTYGDKLLFIIKNGAAAVDDVERKLGKEKAEQLKPHVACCKQWARDLGIWNDQDEMELEGKNGASTIDRSSPSVKDEKEVPYDNNGNSNEKKEDSKTSKETTETAVVRDTSSKTTSAVATSLTQLRRLQQHFEKRVENIRTYVVKHADPDLFLLETMMNKDEALAGNKKATKLLALNLTKRMQYIQQQRQQREGGTETPESSLSSSQRSQKDSPNSSALLSLQQALDKAQKSVPAPTKNDSKRLEASLRYLDKMRAGSTALMNYWTLNEDRINTAPRQTLKKIYNVVSESMDFVVNATKDERFQNKEQYGKDTAFAVTLQDAWTKRMELPALVSKNVSVDSNDDKSSESEPPPTKRPRTNRGQPCYKAKLLFHPSRKVPSQLLSAVKRRGFRLVQPQESNKGSCVNSSYLVMDFGSAFTMTVFLCPLTVTIRAMPQYDGLSKNQSEVTVNSISTSSSGIDWDNPLSNATAVWQPLSYGLSTYQQSDNTSRLLSVWGCSSTYDSIGRVVEERLRDASTHATYVLRRCFQNHVREGQDFEVEILEGSALVEFLNITRATYLPLQEDIAY